MRKIDQFINQYPLSKTLRFQLLPVGKTEENFNNKLLLQEDEKRAEDYGKVKDYLDQYYREFIENTLSGLYLEGISEYSNLYFSKNRDNKKLQSVEEKLRKQIAASFKEQKEFPLLFKGPIIKDILPNYLKNEEQLKIVAEFYNFTTYFTGFFTNRFNIFTAEAKATGIANRCINDNLPKFLDNVRSYRNIREILNDQLREADSTLVPLYTLINNIEHLDDVFSEKFYSCFLSQSSIEVYNKIIGGYVNNDGMKLQGINELVNLYNQQNKSRLPLLKPLYKQILSERESVSFIPEKYASDNELLSSLNYFYLGGEESIKIIIRDLKALFDNFSEYDKAGIHIINGSPITNLSNEMTGNWATIQDNWNELYDAQTLKKGKAINEAYYEKRRKIYKSKLSFDLEQIQLLCPDYSVIDYYKESVSNLCNLITLRYKDAEDLLSKEHIEEKRLFRNHEAIDRIKRFLDGIKALEWLVKPLNGTGKEVYKDEIFYSRFLPLYTSLKNVDIVYDKVRNYLTQKPYSKEKIKLNFKNPDLLSGWPYTKERASSSIILRKEGQYYLGIMDAEKKARFIEYPYTKGNNNKIEKMFYYQAADPAKDVQNLMVIDGMTVKKNGRRDANGENTILEELKNTYLPSDINRIRKEKSYSLQSPSFKREDLDSFINYYAQRTKEYFDKLDFTFKKPQEYKSFVDFTNHVNSQAYQVAFHPIDQEYIDQLVEEGSLYLFQIYNKDFSVFSKGNPNLHTLYFKMLFDPRNLEDLVFKLNGEAEMFYRKKSIKDTEKIVHPANEPIKSKNPLNHKKESCFEYDIIKDRRYTERSFMLHLPITLNFQAPGNKYINEAVRRALRECDDNYVIGIDRGERNLLYLCVINGKGDIVEQYSLNEIVNEYKGVRHFTDYHRLLDEREKQMHAARQNWTAIESIKELKEGYLSQVVHKICELVEKYDAVIALEDLNSGFKNSRKKVEKQVYQKFEKQLIDKLNFMTDKKKPATEKGGLLNAYQLANNGAQYMNKGSQNGFVFYVPAWLTSKIDPVTGFVNLLYPKYTSVAESREYFGKMDSICYNREKDYFEFNIDYSKYPRTEASFRKKWTICTNGERIRSYRNKEKNNEWDYDIVKLTDAYKELFSAFDIPCDKGIKNSILLQDSKEFFEKLFYLFRLTLQMRNSISGRTDVDYIVSPVKDAAGHFYDSRKHENSLLLPQDADANGAYNIARKALYIIDTLKNCSEEEVAKKSLTITNKEWLEYVQANDRESD